MRSMQADWVNLPSRLEASREGGQISNILSTPSKCVVLNLQVQGKGGHIRGRVCLEFQACGWGRGLTSSPQAQHSDSGARSTVVFRVSISGGPPLGRAQA